jgi:hypothetical protein
MAALSLVAMIASGSVVPRHMENASKLRQFIQRVLDYVDSKLSLPPT